MVLKAPFIPDNISRTCVPSTTDSVTTLVVQWGRFLVLRPEPGQGEALV